MDRDSRLTAQLAPLDAALMTAAHEQADASLRDARAKAEAAAARGAAKAQTVLDEATAEGERAAARAAAHRLVDGKRRARKLVLTAQRAAYESLVAESTAAAEALRSQPEYADLEGRLVQIAQAALGADVTIDRDPAGHGGLRASSRGRTLDLTLASLARRCIERLGQEVTRLWA